MDAQNKNLQQDTSAVQTTTVVATFAKRKNRGNQNTRKKADADEEDDNDQTAVVKKAKQIRPNTFTTKTERTEDLSGVQYDSNKSIQAGRDTLATAMLETETELDRDARALREKVLKQGGGEVEDDGTYKGMTGYVDYRKGFRREHNVGAEKGTGSHGPLRASMYTRVTARFDYQPDVCKDYKETGFCSYGDSCKFMHDRGDYKSGWELERDWNEEQEKKLEEKMKGWNPDEEDEAEGKTAEEEGDDDGLPFACYTCRRSWEECKTAVITRCKHYFCESCALKNNVKSGKCEVCGQATQGIFNMAHDVLKKLKMMKEKGSVQ
ncbi:hypothetical protein CEUSTIGMA_g11331.t1 [Chlamydomonas eustigma]|uniref:Uncharacterized protein n=1 Tax=Chlamydomonas eustigma TaxID=1157962 RepID=A0A250XLG7_9CHLO|nr:hypothetical protein CEUSTIGMA_g11331.t1 [Chlamydomonas eustigma]|eukprot:GAX83907.1 hypothetical protein CEUSTIGMA_g11331.t1 [Chlamydomonas eustigma]